MDAPRLPFALPLTSTSNVNTEPSTITTTGPPAALNFKKARSHLRTIRQREALGGFIRAGWSPSELAEFARQHCAPGNNQPTGPSYRHAVEQGANHPSAVETLASLRNRHPTTKLL